MGGEVDIDAHLGFRRGEPKKSAKQKQKAENLLRMEPPQGLSILLYLIDVIHAEQGKLQSLSKVDEKRVDMRSLPGCGEVAQPS